MHALAPVAVDLGSGGSQIPCYHRTVGVGHAIDRCIMCTGVPYRYYLDNLSEFAQIALTSVDLAFDLLVCLGLRPTTVALSRLLS